MNEEDIKRLIADLESLPENYNRFEFALMLGMEVERRMRFKFYEHINGLLETVDQMNHPQQKEAKE